MSATLQSTEGARAWELRAAWALGREVLLVLEEPARPERVRGYVVWVAPTGAVVRIDDGLGEPLHVPVARILTVARSDPGNGGGPRRARPAIILPRPGQMVLDGLDE